MRINGLIQATEQIHQNFIDVVISERRYQDFLSDHSQFEILHKRLVEIVHRVENLCKKRRASPADLPNPSYRAYQWLNFLSQKKWLISHLHALRDFYKITYEVLVKPGVSTDRRIEIRIAHFNYLFRCNQNQGLVKLEINEGFLSAPEQIKRKLVETALNSRKRKHNQSLREYTQTEDYRRISVSLQSGNQTNLRSYLGQNHDLLNLFNKLNKEYFHQQLDQPRIMWSARRSKRRLGYYDPQSDTITINRRFDSQDTPQILVEYILYHEMLHKSLGIREVNGRRYAHTNVFKKAEKRFKDYQRAEKLIKQSNQ